MNDIKIIDVVERYIRGEMNPEERLQFEQLRKTNTEIDQLVVEHTLFLQQMNRFGQRKSFKSALNDIHVDLAEQGKIDSMKLTGKAKVVYLWKRYKRVAAIAATIAGVTALSVSAIVNAFSPKGNNEQLTQLSRDVQDIKITQTVQGTEVKKLKNSMNTSPIPFKAGGSGFLIDGKGYLVTNAHIIHSSRNIVSRNIVVINGKGEQYNATIAKIFLEKDIAILKIEDETFKPLASLPYGIRKSSTDVAEPIYTLGYPRNEIVYSEGYLSAKTGFNGDTLSCQLGIAVNRGNSGGPVFNHDGEVIGIISTKEMEAEGVAFAIQSRFIYSAVEELKKDPIYQSVRIPTKSSVKGLDAKQQFKKIEDYVFMVKAD